MTGRPSDYTQEIATTICGLMAEGMSLRKICALDGMPDKATVFRWLAKHPSFRDQYAQAQEDRTNAMAEELLEIADQYDAESDNATPDHINRARLRIDTRKWLLAKMRPKKYGDKITQEHTGADGGAVVFKTIYEKE